MGKGLSIDVCYHWCPVGKHDWSHVITSNLAKIDEWRRVCPEHAVNPAASTTVEKETR